MRPLLAPMVPALMLLFAFTGLFTAAYRDPDPHDIPVAVVGSDSVARGVQAGAQEIEDVAPLPAHDSRGLSSVFTVFGVVIPSVVFGALLTLRGAGTSARARWAVVGGFAVLAGLLSAVTADVVVGALTGAFWPLAAVSALVAFGVAAAVHGLSRGLGPPVLVLLGWAGVGVALDRLATHHPRLAIGLSRTPAASAAA